MDWKVVARGGRPSPETIEALSRLTGLRRDEVLLALSKDGLVAGAGLNEERAQRLADRLSRDCGIACRILPDSEQSPEEPKFRVLLAGFKPGYRSRLRRKLQELTGLPPEQVVLWLSRMPFALSKNVDAQKAGSIKRAVISAGGIVRIEADVLSSSSSSDGRGGAPAEEAAVFSISRNPAQQTSESPCLSRSPSGESEFTGRPDGSIPPELQETGKSEPANPPEMADIEIYPPDPVPIIQGCQVTPPPFAELAAVDGDTHAEVPAVFHPGPPPLTGNPFNEPANSVLPHCGRRSQPPSKICFAPPGVIEESLPPLPGGSVSQPSGPAPMKVHLYPPCMSVAEEQLLPPLIEVSHAENDGNSVVYPPPVIEFRCIDHETQPTPLTEIFELVPPDPDELFNAPDVMKSAESAVSNGEPAEVPAVRSPAAAEISEVWNRTASVTQVSASGSPERTARRKKKRKRKRTVHMKPPAPAYELPPAKASIHLYLFTPTEGMEQNVTEALVEVLGMDPAAAADLVTHCPAWLAGFPDHRRAMGVARVLENRGATLSITRGSLPDGGEPVRSTPGFQTWLASNG